MDTVRRQKPGDQLAVGDWLAPGELLDGAAEVLYVHSWPASADRSRDNTGTHVRLVVREQGSTPDYSDVVSGAAVFDLATDADLDQLRQQAQREELAAELRDMADKILNSAMPVPQYGITMHGSFNSPDEVRAAAEVFSLPVETRKPHAGIQTQEWPQGRKSYEKGIHLHWLTITEEPESEPEPDPIGLAYSRADDADDPAPVSGARVEPHVGGLTDDGLVDETPPTHYTRHEDVTECGIPIADLPNSHNATNVGGAVTCRSCVGGTPF